jgi:peptidoglycan hydrolase CwlO-like protein
MKKVFLSICLSLLIIPVFAQSNNSQMLSNEVLMNFIGYFESIMISLEPFQNEVNALNNSIDGTDGMSPIQQLMTLEVPSEINQVFTDHSMGDNGFKKMFLISTCFSIVEVEAAVSFGISHAKNANVKNQFQDQLNALNMLKMDIHPADLLLIKMNRDILRPLFS